MELRIRTIEQIKDEIQKEGRENKQVMNFPESIDFPFPELYKEIVTKYDCIEISSMCGFWGLYSSAHSINVAEKFYNADWSKNDYKEKIKNYWFIGDYSDYDEYWIMDKKGKIYYWEYDTDEYGKKYSNIVDVNINFEQWLQFAYLCRDNDEIVDDIYSNGNGMDPICYRSDEEDAMKEYYKKLQEISKELSEFISDKEI